MAGQSQGAFAQIAIGGQKIETAVRLVDRSTYGLVDPNPETFSGILDNVEETVSAGIQTFALQFLMYPTVDQLDTILPLIGTTESTDVFTLTDDFSSLTFTTIVDRVAKVHTYSNCIIDKAIFRGQKGLKPVSLELHILARTMAEGNAGTFSATTPTLTAPYAFNTGTLTLSGNTEVFDRFVLAIDNHAVVQHNNSETATSIQPSWRQITLGCSTPYTSDEIALLTTNIGSTRSDGYAASLVLSRGNYSTTFAIANVKTQANIPDILGLGEEIRLQQFYNCYKDGSTAALIVTHDATP